MVKSICTFGTLVVDLVVEIDDFVIKSDGWKLAKRAEFNPGGITIITQMIAEFGVQPKWCGWVGDDPIGREALQLLVRKGINTNQVVPTHSNTTIVLALVDANHQNSRIVINESKPPNTIPPSWLGALDDCQIAFIDGYTCIELHQEALYELIRHIKQRGITLVFDPQKAGVKMPIEMLKLVLENTDILTLNEDEGISLSQVPGTPFSLDAVVKQVGTVFHREGPHGSTLLTAGHETHFPGFDISARNTLGAGDCFNGAVLFGLVQNLPLTDVGILANCVGALAASKIGTGLGIPTTPEIKEMLEKKGFDRLCNYW